MFLSFDLKSKEIKIISIKNKYNIINNIKSYGLKANKKAKVLDSKFSIINLINENLNNNDYLMIKGSNSTGLHRIVYNLKQRSLNVI